MGTSKVASPTPLGVDVWINFASNDVMKIILATATFVVLGLMLASPVWAGFNEGVAAHKRGDYITALQEFRTLAEQGDAAAQYRLGFMYDFGKGVPQDYVLAVKWYTKAAEQGNAKAQNHLGIMYSMGLGIPQDYAQAVKWYRKAAEQGDTTAQINLGNKYSNGQGVPQDSVQAAKWYRKAAEQGNDEAQSNLGSMYAKGRGVQRNYAEAAKWYRKAAEQGHASSQYSLGYMYQKGLGVPQDYADAIRWYGKAAKQGDARAQIQLGSMHKKGVGTPQDFALAVKWFRKAAEQGDAVAQLSLGAMYNFGKGVLQDYAQAAKWYRKAAEQGDVGAQFFLGDMFQKGEGVLQDYVQSHKWYNLAASKRQPGKDSPSFASIRPKAAKSRDILARHMSSVQVSKAQRLARSWRPKQQTAISESHTPDPTNTRKRIARTQRQLASLGYDPGPSNGILGPETRAAIRAFETREGLPVTAGLSERLEAALRSANPTQAGGALPAVRPLKKVSTGSGFIVSSQGHIVTNKHVVTKCREVRVAGTGNARQVVKDGKIDLALLKIKPDGRSVATFRSGRGIRAGEDIVVVGYPLRGLLSSEMNVTKGSVSSLAGPGDDRRIIQITAPVQPGNSGGPGLDASGNVVGVVVARLDALKMARLTGKLPQNVNFAISEGATRAFLDAHNVPYETAPSKRQIPTADIAALAKVYTVLIECWK